VQFAPTAPADQLASVTTGLGLKTDVSYVYLPQAISSRYYKEYSNLAYPSAAVVPPMSVVSTITADNAVGGRNPTEYFYGTAVNNYDGRGFLGFDWYQTYDPLTGNISRTYYQQTWTNIDVLWPYTGMARYAGTWNNQLSPNWLQLSEQIPALVNFAVNGNQAVCTAACTKGQSCLPYSNVVSQRSFDLNGTELPRSRTSTTVDCWGSPTQIRVETLDAAGNATGYSKTTNNEYWTNTDKWWLGRLKKSSVTSTRPAN
jgi:Insecticide toxin TcdB middle/N-terminal region